MDLDPRYTYVDGPGGSPRINIWITVVPCPGVALRLSTVIDCTPSEDRMPPVTIDFLKNLPPQRSEAPAAAAAHQEVAGRFTCCSGDFILFRQLERVEAMVAAAGLPLECASSVYEFVRQSACQATNTFYKSVAITVEAGAPGSVIAVDVDEDEDEELPPGAVVGECAICYREYLVGGATSVKLLCSHTFHRKCLDRWTAVKRTCPYCRARVLAGEDYWDDEDDCDDSESEYEYDVPGEEPDDGSSQEVTAAPDDDDDSRTVFETLSMFVSGFFRGEN